MIPLSTIQSNLSQLGRDEQGNFVLKKLNLSNLGISSLENQILIYEGKNIENLTEIESLQNKSYDNSNLSNSNSSSRSNSAKNNKEIDTNEQDTSSIEDATENINNNENIMNNVLSNSTFSFSKIQILQLGENKLNYISKQFPQTFQSISILDLSGNELTAINYLDTFPNLMDLNLANNQLEEFAFKPTFQSLLRKLNLSGNKLNKIEFENTKCLSVVNVSQNHLSTLEAFKSCGVRILNASKNEIKVPSPISVNTLFELDLSDNKIFKLEGLSSINKLKKLNLSNNDIRAKEEISKLSSLVFLAELTLEGNPISESEEYVEFVLYELDQLFTFDDMQIDAEMKVRSRNFYGEDANIRKKIIRVVFNS